MFYRPTTQKQRWVIPLPWLLWPTQLRLPWRAASALVDAHLCCKHIRPDLVQVYQPITWQAVDCTVSEMTYTVSSGAAALNSTQSNPSRGLYYKRQTKTVTNCDSLHQWLLECAGTEAIRMDIFGDAHPLLEPWRHYNGSTRKGGADVTARPIRQPCLPTRLPSTTTTTTAPGMRWNWVNTTRHFWWRESVVGVLTDEPRKAVLMSRNRPIPFRTAVCAYQTCVNNNNNDNNNNNRSSSSSRRRWRRRRRTRTKQELKEEEEKESTQPTGLQNHQHYPNVHFFQSDSRPIKQKSKVGTEISVQLSSCTVIWNRMTRYDLHLDSLHFDSPGISRLIQVILHTITSELRYALQQLRVYIVQRRWRITISNIVSFIIIRRSPSPT